MKDQYVLNGFNSPQGRFAAGEVIPGSVLVEWPREALKNRLVNGDLIPNTLAAKIEAGVLDPDAALVPVGSPVRSESAEAPSAPQSTDEQTDDADDGSGAQDDDTVSTADEDSEDEDEDGEADDEEDDTKDPLPDLSAMTKKEIAGWAKEILKAEVDEGLNRTDLIAKVTEIYNSQ